MPNERKKKMKKFEWAPISMNSMAHNANINFQYYANAAYQLEQCQKRNYICIKYPNSEYEYLLLWQYMRDPNI